MKQPATYLITNQYNTVLYKGVTSDLQKRIWEHKEKLVDGFSKKYNVEKLAYFETHVSMEDAILREKQLKVWK